ncbi:MAG TPA: pyridoxal-phosphate dependent enzyme, partial [Pyrinomonadaceae bacterium]|nr:pyridoxal-phosphate dependent enzyme [Pyrinomonadaceae bacterium]
PRVECFAVEPETGDDTRQSLIKGERVKIPPPPTIADGARVQTPGELTFPITEHNATDVLTVSDEELRETMRFILFRMKLLVEPTGALAAAAVLFDKLPRHLQRIGVVLSGGNVDADMLARIVRSASDNATA